MLMGDFVRACTAQSARLELLSEILFRSVSHLREEGRCSTSVYRWMVVCLRNFTSLRPVAVGVWALCCLFLVTAQRSTLRAAFPVLQRCASLSDFRRLIRLPAGLRFVCVLFVHGADELFAQESLEPVDRQTFLSAFDNADLLQVHEQTGESDVDTANLLALYAEVASRCREKLAADAASANTSSIPSASLVSHAPVMSP
jgi:hypothetical protein